jgi:hypothetical protein
MEMGIEATQAYKFALEEAGLSMGTLQSASDRMRKAQNDAITGNAKAQDSFKALGVSMRDLESADTTKLLELVGRGMADTQGSAEATSAAYDLMGRNSERLKAVMMELNKDGIQAQIEAMKELGVVVDEATIRKLDEAEQKISRFTKQAGNSFSIFAAQVIDTGRVLKEMGNLESGSLFSLSRAAMAVDEGNANAAAMAYNAQLDARKAKLEANAEAERKVQQEIQKQIDALKEKRRIEELSNEELRAELNTRLMNAQAAEMGAKKAGDKAAELEALKEIHALEEQIASIKDDTRGAEAEAAAKQAIADLQDKVRLEEMSNEQLEKELVLRGRAAQEAFRAAESEVDRLAALERMLDIRQRLANVREVIQGEEEQTAADAAQQASERAAEREELSAMLEKRRLAQLGNEELREELNKKLEIARASWAAADSDRDRIDALKEINRLEGDIAGIGDPADAIRDGGRSSPVSDLRRVGAMGSGVAGGLRTDIQIAQRNLSINERALRTLEKIETQGRNGINTGARL